MFYQYTYAKTNAKSNQQNYPTQPFSTTNNTPLHNKPQTTSKQSNNQKHKTENHNKQTAASTQHVAAS
jgi:hypothetical protein